MLAARTRKRKGEEREEEEEEEGRAYKRVLGQGGRQVAKAASPGVTGL